MPGNGTNSKDETEFCACEISGPMDCRVLMLPSMETVPRVISKPQRDSLGLLAEFTFRS